MHANWIRCLILVGYLTMVAMAASITGLTQACNSIPMPNSNGYMVMLEELDTRMIVYGCYLQFELAGDLFSSCPVDTGIWSTTTAPSCIPFQRYPVEYLANGEVHLFATSVFGIDIYHSKVECSYGYTLVGEDVVFWLNGAWSSHLPICVEDNKEEDVEPTSPQSYNREEDVEPTSPQSYSYCAEEYFIPPENGRSEYVHLTSGERFYISVCDIGYDMNGSQVTACKGFRSWDVAPTCTPRVCDYPASSPDHGWYNIGNTSSPPFLKYMCDTNNYILHGDQYRLCLSNGTWTGTTPVCTKPSSATNITVFPSDQTTSGATQNSTTESTTVEDITNSTVEQTPNDTAVTTSQTFTTQSTCLFSCDYVQQFNRQTRFDNLTKEQLFKELELEIEMIVSNLTVNKTTLSRTRRRLSSANDERTSSTVIGTICGSIVFSAVILVPILSDVAKLVMLLFKSR